MLVNYMYCTFPIAFVLKKRDMKRFLVFGQTIIGTLYK